jgi:ATP-binding cassette, subfamily B, bacterial
MNSRNRRIEKKTNTNPKLKTLSFKDRLSALQNVPRFFKLVWPTSPGMTLISAALRIVRSAIPLAILYVGKLIIDEVVLLNAGKGSLSNHQLWKWVAIEFGLVILSDILSRGISLMDGLLGDLFSNHSSVRIMAHAATPDLSGFGLDIH